MAKTETPAAAPAAKFSKQQILAAKKYAERRDLLAVLLEDGKAYALTEVDKHIEEFLMKEFDKPKEKEGE